MGDFKGAMELRRNGAQCFLKSGVKNIKALEMQASDSFETLVLLETETRSMTVNEMMTSAIKNQHGIFGQMSSLLGHRRQSFAKSLEKLWRDEEAEAGGKKKDERSQESEQKDKKKVKKDAGKVKAQAAAAERDKKRGTLEQFRDLSASILKLACLFRLDRSFQLSRPLALLYSRQFDECIFECEYLLACEVPSGGAQAASDQELTSFDLALKAILAQALMFCDDDRHVVARLTRANMIYSAMAGDSQVKTRCVSLFPAMHHLMEDLAVAKAECLGKLTEKTALFPSAYTQYTTAAAEQKKKRSDLIKQAQKLIHRLAQASSTYIESNDVVHSHRQHYSKAYAEVTRIDAKHLSAVGE